MNTFQGNPVNEFTKDKFRETGLLGKVSSKGVKRIWKISFQLS